MEGGAVQQPAINDVSAGSDGTLVVATYDGITVLENQKTVAHIGRFEGIGTSQIVKTVDADAHDRIWFSTPDSVGYFTVDSGSQNPITIDMVTPEIKETPVPREVPTINQSPQRDQGTVTPVKPVSFIDTVLEALSNLIKTINPFR